MASRLLPIKGTTKKPTSYRSVSLLTPPNPSDQLQVQPHRPLIHRATLKI